MPGSSGVFAKGLAETSNLNEHSVPKHYGYCVPGMASLTPIGRSETRIIMENQIREEHGKLLVRSDDGPAHQSQLEPQRPTISLLYTSSEYSSQMIRRSPVSRLVLNPSDSTFEPTQYPENVPRNVEQVASRNRMLPRLPPC